ncbi:MAG: redoxin domain-containing protein [Acidobacteria bacterium]|nr:redoxin domain-containing protein [Acidobacteriota bacterium]
MADFQSRIGEFEERKVAVIVASVDSPENAQKTLERHKLTFPLAYGLNPKEVAARTGAFFDEKKEYVHATGFIIGPDGRVAGAVYSTGPAGRYTAAECVGMVDYLSGKTS